MDTQQYNRDTGYPLERLPHDVIIAILEYLTPQERFALSTLSLKISEIVPHCKTWIFASKSSRTMTKFNNTVKRVETFVVKHGGGNILPLNFYALGMFHSNLKHFQCDDIKSESVKHLGNFCKNLQTMNISSISPFDENDLRTGFRNLRVLRMNCCSNELKAVDHFLGLKHLTVLEIQDSIIVANTDRLDRIKHPAPLQVLNLSHCKRDLRPVFIKCSASLTQADLSFTDITDDDLGVLLQKANRLLTLNLEQCTLITHEGWLTLCQHVTDLEYINVKGTSVGNAAVAALYQKCPRVVEKGVLNLSWCMNLTHEGFLSAFKIFGSKLRVLVAFNTYLADADLHLLSGLCPQLEELDIGGCYSVSDTGVLNILQHCKGLKELRTVDRGKCRLSARFKALLRDSYPQVQVDFVLE